MLLCRSLVSGKGATRPRKLFHYHSGFALRGLLAAQSGHFNTVVSAFGYVQTGGRVVGLMSVIMSASMEVMEMQ